MKGNSLNDFINDMYHAFEKEFIYKGRYFIIQNETRGDKSFIRLDEYPLDKSKNYVESEYLSLEIEGDSFEECAKKLLMTKIIDGKNIYELEKDIEVIYG